MKLNNIPLRLDDRIVDIADIKTVITADENDIGKMGYFANSIHLFKNLEGRDGIKYGKLIYLSDLDYGGDKSDKCFVCSTQWAYRYFIPEDALKSEEPKKKYRPYTLAEWNEQHEIGEVIHYRSKSGEVELRHMYVGTRHSQGIKKIILKITLGDVSHTLDYLFEEYEIEFDGGWKPFGIEEQV